MQRYLSVLLVAAVIFGTGYWYQYVYSRCPAPLTYRIGTVDKEFGLSEGEVRMAVADAESLWEAASGKNLFTYDPEGTIVINFTFDERQALTEEEHTLRDVLDWKETLSGDLRAEYEELLEEYESIRDTYEKRVARYENDLAVHNGKVAYWNNRGGAPSGEYDAMNNEQRRLAREHDALADLADTLNALVDEINELGEKSNAHIRDYNNTVRDYNDRFAREREFTQGDYYRNTITIYQFEDAGELRLVLAHELGHALSLDHVEDEQSVMYHLMEGQHETLSLTEADLRALTDACGA